MVNALAVTALEKKASDVSIIDLRGLVAFCDYFVVATASNPRQVRAIAEAMRLTAKHDYDVHSSGAEGTDSGRWVLCDFGDVVAHI
ncbi:MAG: ribosome-associated protein, partial [Kiritimatiellia bacterium]